MANVDRLEFGVLLEALLGLFKVDHVPNGVEVIRLHVEVLEVEGVLPDVDADEGHVGEERVLVRRRDYLEALRCRVQAEPAPPRALDAEGRGIELLLEGIEATKVAVDGLLEGPILEDAAVAALGGGRREVLPEERVVDVATAIELEGGLESDALLGSGSLGVGLLGSVEGVDVGLVVLSMVKGHDLLGDVRLESIVRVGQVGQSVGHGGSELRGAKQCEGKKEIVVVCIL